MLYRGTQRITPIIRVDKTPTYTYNVDFIGNNINVDKGIASIQGMTTSAYIQTKQPIINQLHTASSWKIVVNYNLLCYKNYSTVFATGDANMTNIDYQAINCTYESDTLRLFLGSNGNNWDIVGWSVDPYGGEYWDPRDNYMLSGCEFILELEFTGTQYTCKIKNLSFGDSTFTTTNSASTTTKIGLSNNSTPTYLILGNNAFRYNEGYVYGALIKYNLLNSYYTIDGVTTYLAEEN